MFDAIEAMKDPNDDIHEILTGLRREAIELADHDRVLASKVTALTDSFDDLISYVKSRAEA